MSGRALFCLFLSSFGFNEDVPMAENDKKVSSSFGLNGDVPMAGNDKKVSFGEEDAANLIERYFFFFLNSCMFCGLLLNLLGC